MDWLNELSLSAAAEPTQEIIQVTMSTVMPKITIADITTEVIVQVVNTTIKPQVVSKQPVSVTAEVTSTMSPVTEVVTEKMMLPLFSESLPVIVPKQKDETSRYEICIVFYINYIMYIYMHLHILFFLYLGYGCPSICQQQRWSKFSCTWLLVLLFWLSFSELQVK